MPATNATTEGLPRNHHPSAIGLCTALGVLTVSVVGARLWTRRFILKRFALEDWLVLVGTNCFVALLVGQGLAVDQFGYNSHIWQLNLDQIVFAAKYLFLGELLLLTTLWVTKMSILLFYSRIAGPAPSFFRYAVYFMMFEIMIHKIIYLIVIFTDCRPLESRWNQLDPQWAETHRYQCHGVELNIIIGSTISAAEDLTFALLPINLVWNLQLPRRQKFGLWCLFALSLVSMTAGFIRTYFIHRGSWESHDFTWNYYWVLTLSVIEACVGLVCSSVPSLKPFYTRYVARHPAPTASPAIILPMPPTSQNRLSTQNRYSCPSRGYQSTTLATSSYAVDSVFNGTTIEKEGEAPLITTESYVTWSPGCLDCGEVACRKSRDRHDSHMDMVRGAQKRVSGDKGSKGAGDAEDMFISVRSSVEVDEDAPVTGRNSGVRDAV